MCCLDLAGFHVWWCKVWKRKLRFPAYQISWESDWVSDSVCDFSQRASSATEGMTEMKFGPRVAWWVRVMSECQIHARMSNTRIVCAQHRENARHNLRHGIDQRIDRMLLWWRSSVTSPKLLLWTSGTTNHVTCIVKWLWTTRPGTTSARAWKSPDTLTALSVKPAVTAAGLASGTTHALPACLCCGLHPPTSLIDNPRYAKMHNASLWSCEA